MTELTATLVERLWRAITSVIALGGGSGLAVVAAGLVVLAAVSLVAGVLRLAARIGLAVLAVGLVLSLHADSSPMDLSWLIPHLSLP